jgi:hypothetical protein
VDAQGTHVRCAGCGASGKRRFALPFSNKQFLAYLSGQRIILVLEPHQRGFQVTHSLLQAAHLRDHTGIKPADVAE